MSSALIGPSATIYSHPTEAISYTETMNHLVLRLAIACSTMMLLVACLPTQTRLDSGTDRLPEMPWPEGDRYQIDATRSEFRVHLTAEGPLAAFGHPHVIGARAIEGQVVVAEPWTESVFQLNVHVDDLIVDPPLWRQQAGLDPEIPVEAIEATRANMRSIEQLNAKDFPLITLQSARLSGTRHQPLIETWVSVAGVVSQQSLPVALHWGEKELIVSGVTTWRLSELGITPFSALGGGLRVGDEVELRVRLYAVSGNDQSMGD